MGSYSINPSYLSVLLVHYYDYIENAGGFAIKDWKKFLGSNKNPAC